MENTGRGDRTGRSRRPSEGPPAQEVPGRAHSRRQAPAARWRAPGAAPLCLERAGPDETAPARRPRRRVFAGRRDAAIPTRCNSDDGDATSARRHSGRRRRRSPKGGPRAVRRRHDPVPGPEPLNRPASRGSQPKPRERGRREAGTLTHLQPPTARRNGTKGWTSRPPRRTDPTSRVAAAVAEVWPRRLPGNRCVCICGR